MSNGLKFLTSAMTGSLSDHHGRRPFILCGMGLACISPICLVLLVGQPNMTPRWYFITTAGHGGLVNWFAVALSALSDVIQPKWRAPSFGLLSATFAIGYAIGPSLALQVGHKAISFLSCALVCATFVLAIFWYPETLPKHVQIASRDCARREEDDFVLGSIPSRSAPPSDTVPGPDGLRIKVLFIAHCLCRPIREMSILNRSYTLRMLSLLAFFSGMVGSADGAFIICYAEDQLDFNDKDIAFASLIRGTFGIILQGILLKPFNDCVGERRVLIVSFCVGVIHNALIGLATTKRMFVFAMVLGCVMNLAFATISAIKSMNVSEQEQGRIQGALYSLQALAWDVGPLVLRAVYTATVNTTGIPGFMFLVASMLYVVAVICAYLLPPEQSDSRRMIMPHDTSETSRRSNNGAPRAESCKSQSSKTNQSLECVVLETPLIDDASRPR
jgi:DHA1 family tetracycline resistance protein-like MFS transporter